MTLQESLALIRGFSSKELLIGGFEGITDAIGIHDVISQKLPTFPAELQAYIREVCPDAEFSFQGVGHPITLLSKPELSWEMEGYKLDPETHKPLPTWNEAWFLIGVEGGEPIIVDLNEQKNVSTVYSAMQGQTGWDFYPIADSIGQFLLCAAAIEHAMNFPGMGESLDEDFNLIGAAASWLFPFLKQYAGSYYDEWASVFENFDQ